MRDIIINSCVGFIGAKALSCFGKKEYSDLLLFVMVLYVGVSIVAKVGGWYDGLMHSAFIQLMQKIFG